MRFLSLLFAALVLAGCAHPWNAVRLAPGTPRDQVLASAGQPTRVLPLPGDGERLQYTMQPMGRYAFMVDLDASGRLVQARQVLTEQDFNRIQVGTWTRAEVEREFGPPAWIDAVSSWNGPVMTYRWSDGSNMFYWVYLDRQDIVRRAHPGMEFVNAPNERR